MIKVIERENRLPVIKTDRLMLRDITLEDISDEYLVWINLPSVTKYLEIRFNEQTRENVVDFLQSKLKDIKNTQHFGIYDQGGKRLVGNVTLNKINWKHKYSDISYIIGHEDVVGYGYATEAVKAMVEYAFDYLGLMKIYAGYYDGHIGSARVLQKSGFAQEARLRKHLINYCGERVDKIMVGMTKEDYDNKKIGFN